jgi:hypothetical protein
MTSVEPMLLGTDDGVARGSKHTGNWRIVGTLKDDRAVMR